MFRNPDCQTCGDISSVDRFGFWCETCQASVEVISASSLPDGVHELSMESMMILAKANSRGQHIARCHTTTNLTFGGVKLEITGGWPPLKRGS